MTGISKRNQHFRTSDLVSLVLLCGIVSSVLGAIIAQALQDNRPARARATAEAFAQQLLQSQGERGEAPAGAGRSPASEALAVPALTEGSIGRDPWGRPFHFTVRQLGDQPSRIVIVWSDGPNGRSESEPQHADDQNLAVFQFLGDDVGFTHREKLNR